MVRCLESSTAILPPSTGKAGKPKPPWRRPAANWPICWGPPPGGSSSPAAAAKPTTWCSRVWPWPACRQKPPYHLHHRASFGPESLLLARKNGFRVTYLPVDCRRPGPAGRFGPGPDPRHLSGEHHAGQQRDRGHSTDSGTGSLSSGRGRAFSHRRRPGRGQNPGGCGSPGG